jgi:hypothetical protein
LEKRVVVALYILWWRFYEGGLENYHRSKVDGNRALSPTPIVPTNKPSFNDAQGLRSEREASEKQLRLLIKDATRM